MDAPSHIISVVLDEVNSVMIATVYFSLRHKYISCKLVCSHAKALPENIELSKGKSTKTTRVSESFRRSKR